MSEAAYRERAVKQHWAEPGSRHDRVVRLAKLGLPVLALALLLLLAIAPFGRKGDVSFILDKNKVDEAEERMRVEAARYSGKDNEGRNFAIVANQAIQPSSSQPVVQIHGMAARLDLANGPLTIQAPQGRYNLETQKVLVDGAVRVAGPDGYRLETSDVGVDLKTRRLSSAGPVQGSMRLGEFSAGHLNADLGSRSVSLTGGARLKIVQGALR
ncbi:LPS export ABC transporter periplasmic protein LptC [Sphingomonas rhizophila]|uniref:LPS export ABC transporter periplasmic protein LptC n=1 Tax=Sphingomonas rhizophila TaxID=2071607 RepID=A0A7G9SAQ5_9SPHN|nr:LPS export ABC transporter periplasmic protein LptC [Sphingomonas rhizophila]QNN64930.1 LPS export ABC transporter periplasmic protein LptC [Sphingomonas rhizophila]